MLIEITESGKQETRNQENRKSGKSRKPGSQEFCFMMGVVMRVAFSL
jgi:hypothetical protein